jgi:EAL domain-containing protein (putative c-di-GMP-specific phosphodiesterase class I)
MSQPGGGRVVAVHARQLVADVVSRVIDGIEGFSAVAVPAGAGEVVPTLLAHRPDVVVVEDAPPDVDGQSLVLEMRELAPSTAFVLLTGDSSGRAVVRALHSGCRGFMHTARASGELVGILRTVVAGGTVFPGDAIADTPRLDDLVVHYQPVVDLEGNGVVETEALVRWNHPMVGLRGPAEFLPQAEVTGLIEPLGWHVLGQACRQAAAWRAELPDAEGLSMAVNVSLRQLVATDVVDRVQDALDQAGLAPDALVLEFPETALAAGDAPLIDRLQAVAALGVELRVDDFGTSQSSLVHLRRLPISALKIDYDFVNAMLARSNAADIVGAIVALAHSLGMRSVAEGIENEREVSLLRELGCELGQGYVWARPLDAEAFASWYLDHLGLPCRPAATQRDNGRDRANGTVTLKYEHCGWCHRRGAYLVPGRPILRCRYCQAHFDVSALSPGRLSERLDVYARNLQGRRTAEHVNRAGACSECRPGRSPR